MKVLLLEDDPFLQFDVAEMVTSLGHDVVGPFSAEAKAIAACQHDLPDAAILDFNLGENAHSEQVADLLDANGVPFVFTTGHDRRYLPQRFAHVPLIEKPFAETDISAFLDQARTSDS